MIIGFPCNQFGQQEPGDASQIEQGCLINYGVSFLITDKVDVNGNISWTKQEHEIWKILYERQIEVIKNRACEEFVHGLEILKLSSNSIPQPHDVSKILFESTGWSIEPVNAVIPAKEFFTLLANKKFPAASFIRRYEDIDYLQEPDIFHELFGHCPLLTNQAYADFVQAYGKMALRADAQERKSLFRIFWYTIEFGLIKTKNGIRILGGGILSSHKETLIALNKKKSAYLNFSTNETLRTPFRIDIVQPQYFVLDGYESLYKIMKENLMQKIIVAQKLGDYKPCFEYDPCKKDSRYN